MRTLILFNLVIISFFSFLTSWALVELALSGFRIKAFRFKAIVRMIPLIKLPLDLFFLNWDRWSIIYGVYPWLCEKGSRTLEAFYNLPKNMQDLLLPNMGIRLRTKDFLHFSIADRIYGFASDKAIYLFILLFLVFWVFSIAFKSIKWLKEGLEIKRLIKTSQKLNLKLSNVKIIKALEKYNLELLHNDEYTDSPFVTGLVTA